MHVFETRTHVKSYQPRQTAPTFLTPFHLYSTIYCAARYLYVIYTFFYEPVPTTPSAMVYRNIVEITNTSGRTVQLVEDTRCLFPRPVLWSTASVSVSDRSRESAGAGRDARSIKTKRRPRPLATTAYVILSEP